MEQLDLSTSIEYLTKAAEGGRYISYGDLVLAHGRRWQEVRRSLQGEGGHLDQILAYCHSNKLPWLSAICVNRQNMETGKLEDDALHGFTAGIRRLDVPVADPIMFLQEAQSDCFAWGAQRRQNRPGTGLKVKDICDRIRWTDQVYGRGHREAPVLTFPARPGQQITYTSRKLSGNDRLEWATDYIAQYVPQNTPKADERWLAGRVSALVSVYPFVGSTREFVEPHIVEEWNLDRWPDAIMVREVYWLVDPPKLRDIYPAEHYKKITSFARGVLGRPLPELYNAIADHEVEPVLDLYRSRKAMDYLTKQIEGEPSMQVVANRRTGKAGWVYGLSLPEYPGHMKIGSAFDVSVRINTFSTAVPVDYLVEGKALFDDCRAAERAMHAELARARCRQDREWFICDETEFRRAEKKIRSAGYN